MGHSLVPSIFIFHFSSMNIFPPRKADQVIDKHMRRPLWNNFSTILKPLLMSPPAIFCLLVLLQTATRMSSALATDFVYNTNFNSTNILLYGNANVQSSILTLTNGSFFSIGRVFHPHKVSTKAINSSTLLPFATSFIFSIAPVKHYLTGHGFAFIFSPSGGINGTTSAEYIGLLNRTNEGKPYDHLFGVEFDIRKNVEFNDINDNHVGIDINSLTSLTAHAAGYWSGKDDNEFKILKLNNGENYQAWIEFKDSQLNVTMARAGTKRPHRPLISKNVNLSEVLLDEMYVGFCAATGLLLDTVRIMAWSFSNRNLSIGDGLVTNNLPSFVPKKGLFYGAGALVIGFIVVCVIIIGFSSVVFVVLWKRRGKAEDEIEEWELEYWPHRISYQEIEAATRGFSEENVIGIGGNEKVYKGLLQGAEVAVKRIPQETDEGMREFLAEVSSLGRMKHRNLVGLRGWCKKEKGNLILVYDYMENGSLDKRIFECEERDLLSWEKRIQVLKNVAAGILYLHEGWEVKVLHRDIKASNVLLDKDMNARLGDFGLARMHNHQGQVATTTKVIGTVGYLPPEVIRTGRVSDLSDVFGFGVLVLEVVCGRRPIEENKPLLIDWLLSLMEIGELHCALDGRLTDKGRYTIQEVEKLLRLGLLCANSDPSVRPTMRQIVNMLEGLSEGNESKQDIVGMSLPEKIKSAAMWSETSMTSPYRHYPTIDELKLFSSSSKTSRTTSYVIPDSDSFQEGR